MTRTLCHLNLIFSIIYPLLIRPQKQMSIITPRWKKSISFWQINYSYVRVWFFFIIPKLEIGRECTKDGDCIINAYCHEGRICLCKERFIAINTSRKTFICVNEASFIGDSCLYDIQCTSAYGIHALCKRNPGESETISGRCDCKNDSHYQDGICYKNSRIGESCHVNDNCVIQTPNLVAYCDQSRCVCPPYYHANQNGSDCLPSSDLGGPCLNDEDCIIMNSRCFNVCDCKMGYVMNQRKTHCLLAADRLHSPCDEDKQCTAFLPRTMCDPNSSRCNCSVGSHEVNGACYKSTRLHESCKQKEECLINSRNLTRVECYQGFCLCANDYETTNRTDCVDTRSLPGTPGSGALLHVNVLLVLVYEIIHFL